MGGLIATYVDAHLLDWLLRVDAAIMVIMSAVALYLVREFLVERQKGPCERPIQLMLAFAAMAAWIALEVGWLGMSRAVVLAGITTGWWFSAPPRLLVPTLGLVIGIAVWWLVAGRQWLTTAIIALAAVPLIWPEPAIWAAVAIYRIIIAP